MELKSGEVKYRRNILLIDESNLSICVCFWGEKVVNSLDFSGFPVVAIKNAKVSDFASKSLNSNEDSIVYLNCDFERAKDVREWFDTLDRENMEIHPLSVGSGMDNLLKEGPKDETLRRFCQPIRHGANSHLLNPEDANTIEQEEGI